MVERVPMNEHSVVEWEGRTKWMNMRNIFQFLSAHYCVCTIRMRVGCERLPEKFEIFFLFSHSFFFPETFYSSHWAESWGGIMKMFHENCFSCTQQHPSDIATENCISCGYVESLIVTIASHIAQGWIISFKNNIRYKIKYLSYNWKKYLLSFECVYMIQLSTTKSSYIYGTDIECLLWSSNDVESFKEFVLHCRDMKWGQSNEISRIFSFRWSQFSCPPQGIYMNLSNYTRNEISAEFSILSNVICIRHERLANERLHRLRIETITKVKNFFLYHVKK